MNDTKVFRYGWFAGFLMAIAAQGGNWLISPMAHPDASPLRRYGVIAQVVVCLGFSLWFTLRKRSSIPPAA